MNTILDIKENSAIQKHIDILQNIITRMSSNSANCKTWCFGLVGAMLALFVQSEKSDCLWIAIIPTLLFYIADSYYVSLERDFRILYSEFVDYKTVFVIKPISSLTHRVLVLGKSLLSFSTVMFYILLILIIIVLQIAI